MRKIFTVALLLIVATSCANRGFEFEVTAYLEPQTEYYLTPDENTSHYYIKSKSDATGEVRFQGRMKQPVCAVISDGITSVAGPFFVEKGSVQLRPYAQSPDVMIAYGTPSNDAYNNYRIKLQDLENKYDTMRNLCGCDVSVLMTREFDSLGEAVEKANYDNIFGVYMFVNEGIVALTPAEADSVRALFSSDMQQSYLMVDAIEKLKKMQKK